MIQYPEVLDLESLTTIIDIVKKRELNTRRQEFCLCGWNAAGYLLKISVGLPNKGPSSTFYAHSGAIQEGLEELEELLTDYESGPQTFTASAEEDPKDIGTIITIISIVLSLLRSLGFTRKVRKENHFTNAGMVPGVDYDEMAEAIADANEVDQDEYEAGHIGGEVE